MRFSESRAFGALVVGTALCGMLSACSTAPRPSSSKAPVEVPVVSADVSSTETCEKLVTNLRRIPSKKTEYETTAQFNDRVAAALAERLSGGVYIHSVLQFEVPAKFSQSYDADTKVLTMQLRTLSDRFDARELGSLRYVFYEGSSERSSYSGSNAFGATRSIQKVVNSGCSVALLNSPTFWPASDKVAVPGVAPERAKAMHNDVGVVFEVRLSPPLLGKLDSRLAPSLDYPYDISYMGNAVFGHLRRVIAFVKSTKEVLGTIDWPQ